MSKKQTETALLLKALAHSAQLAIIDYLLKKEGCICNDIVAALPLAQPTVSQHPKVLKNAGIIKGTIEGTAICYCLNEKALQKIQEYLTALFRKRMNTLSCCLPDQITS